MVRIMASLEQDNFFMENSDGSFGPIDKEAAGVLVAVWALADKVYHYTTSEYEIWEYLG